MSSILLSNPFASQPPPSTSAPAVTANTHIIAAPQAAPGGSGAGNSTSFGNSGGGYGSGKQGPLAFLAKALERGPERPAKPTGDSIVNAQTQDRAQAEAREALTIGPDLPAVAMPDPLPTSPFLLQLSEKAGAPTT